MAHPLMDLPLGGAIVPKEEIRKAAILKIEVSSNLHFQYFSFRSSKVLQCPRTLFYKLTPAV